MNWYYADAGQQAGPVDDAQLDALIRSGKIAPDTLVWHQGMANWQPLREAEPAATTIAPSPSPTAPAVATTSAQAPITGDEVVCAECGRIFSTSEAIQYGTTWVCAACKPVFIQKVREGTISTVTPGGGFHYGGFWIRFVAKLIDGLILSVVLVIPIVFLVLAAVRSGGGRQAETFIAAMQILFQLAYLAISLGYNTFFLGKYGATPGKMAVGIKVVSPDGAPITYARALGRSAGELLSGLICDIGYIIAAFDSEKRALHDHMAGTRVVYK
jgi:uncharacterized RDD family membrane protein YckC/DNA-directed RNA polymerase subunit RPC12/RpoP